MDKVLKIGHSYNLGDLVTILPGLQALWKTKGIKTAIYQRLGLKREEHALKDAQGDSICMDTSGYENIKPLLESQEYVESFNIWCGESVDWNFDKVRDSNSIPIPASDIHWWNFFIFPELQCDLSEPWIHVKPDNFLGERILVNMTDRYRNPYITYYFLKEYQDRLDFIGTIAEWEKFQKQWDLNIDRYECANFLDLAKVLKGCRFFIGCQSFAWHVANSMAVPRILEACSSFPNTLPTTKNGFAYLHQEALEFLFHKLNS